MYYTSCTTGISYYTSCTSVKPSLNFFAHPYQKYKKVFLGFYLYICDVDEHDKALDSAGPFTQVEKDRDWSEVQA